MFSFQMFPVFECSDFGFPLYWFRGSLQFKRDKGKGWGLKFVRRHQICARSSSLCDVIKFMWRNERLPLPWFWSIWCSFLKIRQNIRVGWRFFRTFLLPCPPISARTPFFRIQSKPPKACNKNNLWARFDSWCHLRRHANLVGTYSPPGAHMCNGISAVSYDLYMR